MPKQDITLELIQEHAYIQYRKAQARLLKSDRFGFHATDYSNECARKVTYGKMAEDRGVATMDTETMDTFFFGQAVHRVSNLEGLANELALCWDMVREKSIPFVDGIPKGTKFEDKKAVSIDGHPLVDFIIGAADDIVVHPNIGNYIVDKKTYTFKGFPLKKPYDSHVTQINIYRVLLNKCKKIDAKYGCNFYIDKTGTSRTPFRFAYQLADIETTYAHMQARRDMYLKWLNTGEIPDRTITWQCDGYCSWAQQCFSDAP